MKHRIVMGDEVIPIIEKYYLGVNDIMLCSPFLSRETIESIFNILDQKSQVNLTFITKYDPLDLLLNVSDEGAFDTIFKMNEKSNWNIKVVIVNHLHAKAIVLGSEVAIIGSFNLTRSGVNYNRELGIGIFHRDSKIKTIRDRLEKFIGRGYELTKSHFEQSYRINSATYQKKAKRIKKLLFEIKRERDVGLQSFYSGSKSNHSIEYFNGLISVLGYIAKNSPRESACLNWLQHSSPRDGKKINEHRLNFLRNLGLVEKISDRVHISPIGEQIMAKQTVQKAKEQLYFLISGMYPEFEKIVGQFKNGVSIHPIDLVKQKEFSRSEEYWAIRLRWLESLDIVETVKDGRRKLYRLN